MRLRPRRLTEAAARGSFVDLWPLLEPMVRIRFVVKRADFAISAASIQRLGFGERLIGFETEHWKAPLPREILQTMQDALTNPEAARGWRHPHALDFAVGCMALQRAT